MDDTKKSGREAVFNPYSTQVVKQDAIKLLEPAVKAILNKNKESEE